MRKLLILALILFLVFSIVPSYYRASAQNGLQCDSFLTFPDGWSVAHGDIKPYYQLGVSGNAAFGTSGTDPDGYSANFARASFSTGIGQNIASVSYAWSYSGFYDEFDSYVLIELLRYGVVVASQKHVDNAYLSPGDWTTFTEDFSYYTGKSDEIRITVDHRDTGAHGANPIGFTPSTVCSTGINTPPPQPQPPTETPTSTLTPSRTTTSTYTLTPSTTPTPIPTTGSETATQTPGPTQTGSPSSFDVGPELGGITLQTIAPPDVSGCGDTVNPCGALPFAPPAYATVAIESPTAVSSITAYPTQGTPTLVGFSSTVIAFATGLPAPGGIASISTLTINDIQGTPVSLQNVANDLGSRAGVLFGMARAFSSINLGKTGTILAFLFLILMFIVLVRLIVGVYRVFMKIYRLLQRFRRDANPVSYITGGGE